MAPGYVFFGAGTTFAPKQKNFNLYLSPSTWKSTFVLDETLSEQGAFGVTKGEKMFVEFGALVTNSWKKEIMKNVLLDHRLNLYTDYLKSFGNIDVNWELNFVLKVNDHLQTNLGMHMIYDDDIKFDEVKDADGVITDPGVPKIQFKQALGIGFITKF